MSLGKTLATAAALLALGTGITACGSSSGGSSTQAAASAQADVSPPGDIPDNQAFVPYAPPGGGYTVSVPEGWSRTSQAGATTFTDKLNSVQIEHRQAQTAPTVDQAKSRVVPELQKTVPGFQAGDVALATRNGGDAVLITYLADGQPNAVTGNTDQNAVERYTFYKDGKEVVLTLSGPKGADNVDPWRTITDSLRFTG